MSSPTAVHFPGALCARAVQSGVAAPDDWDDPLPKTAASSRALALCWACPDRAPCLAAGMGEPAGIWGGVTAPEREKIIRDRNRQRRDGKGRFIPKGEL